MNIDELTVWTVTGYETKIDEFSDSPRYNACTCEYERCDLCLKEAARIFAKAMEVYNDTCLRETVDKMWVMYHYLNYVCNCMSRVYNFYVLMAPECRDFLLSPMEEHFLCGLAKSAYFTVCYGCKERFLANRDKDIFSDNKDMFLNLVVAPFDAALNGLLAFHNAA